MTVIRKVWEEGLQKVVEGHASQDCRRDAPEAMLIGVAYVHFRC